MDDECRSLREAIDRVRDGRHRWRCPQVLRSKVVVFARERVSAGDDVGRIAQSLGLSRNGLVHWLRTADRGFRQVRLLPESSSCGSLVLVTPQGFRLEGLSEDQALRLLREL